MLRYEAHDLGGRFGAIPRKMIPERVNKAKREARPDRRSEIERHPGNLILPLGKVMRHDPTRARVTETLERTQNFAAIRKPILPSVQVHRYVDGDEKSQIGCNPDDGDDEAQANQTVELRQQPAKADPNHEEGNCPDRIFDGIGQIVGRQHPVPRAALRHDDQRHDRPGDVQGGVHSRYPTQLVQDDGPLRCEADLGHGRHGPADDNAR